MAGAGGRRPARRISGQYKPRPAIFGNSSIGEAGAGSTDLNWIERRSGQPGQYVIPLAPWEFGLSMVGFDSSGPPGSHPYAGWLDRVERPFRWRGLIVGGRAAGCRLQYITGGSRPRRIRGAGLALEAVPRITTGP